MRGRWILSVSLRYWISTNNELTERQFLTIFFNADYGVKLSAEGGVPML